MPRTFAYVRVSTTGQTTENQIQEIEAAGFHVEPRRIVTETVSGSTAIAQRRGFSRLMDRMEAGDVLIVTKLAWYFGPRLQQPASDIQPQISMVEKGLDSSPSGRAFRHATAKACARAMLAEPSVTVVDVARRLGVSPSTLYGVGTRTVLPDTLRSNGM